MAAIKLKHVNQFYDRHGKLRYLCRPPGFKSKTLEGAPGSEEFLSDYHNWLEKAGVTPRNGSARSEPNATPGRSMLC
jgi:hypothetical protein